MGLHLKTFLLVFHFFSLSNIFYIIVSGLDIFYAIYAPVDSLLPYHLGLRCSHFSPYIRRIRHEDMASSVPTNILIYVLRNDLRYTDNPVLHEIQKSYDASTADFTHVLPIYVFPSHQVEVSGFIPLSDDAASTPKSPYPEARSKVAGFWRCGPHRAKFLAESVWDLKNTLEQKESCLVIRVGKVTDVLRDIFNHLDGAEDPSGKAHTASAKRQVVGVWMTKAYGFEEDQEADAIQSVVEKAGAQFRHFTDEKYYIHEYVLPTPIPAFRVACCGTFSYRPSSQISCASSERIHKSNGGAVMTLH